MKQLELIHQSLGDKQSLIKMIKTDTTMFLEYFNNTLDSLNKNGIIDDRTAYNTIVTFNTNTNKMALQCTRFTDDDKIKYLDYELED